MLNKLLSVELPLMETYAQWDFNYFHIHAILMLCILILITIYLLQVAILFILLSIFI